MLSGHVHVHEKLEAAEVVNAERARLILNVGVVPGDVFEIQFSNTLDNASHAVRGQKAATLASAGMVPSRLGAN